MSALWSRCRRGPRQTVTTGPTVADAMASPAAPLPPTSASASSGAASQFKFDANRLSRADRIAGGATLVLLISLFLPWFSYRFGSALLSGTYSWDGLVHGYLYLVLIICLAIIAYLVLLAGFEQTALQDAARARSGDI